MGLWLVGFSPNYHTMNEAESVALHITVELCGSDPWIRDICILKFVCAGNYLRKC